MEVARYVRHWPYKRSEKPTAVGRIIMHNFSNLFSLQEPQTPFSILADYDEVQRPTASDVKPVVKVKNKPVVAAKAVTTPWYAQVQSQPLIISDEVREELGFKPTPVFQPTVAEKAEFWQKLCLFGLDTNMLIDSDIANLIEAPVGSINQINAASGISAKILNAYHERAEFHESKVLGHLKAFGATEGINAEMTDWYTDGAKSNWGFDLTLDDDDLYGEDYDELDNSFNGLGIRIEHCSRVSTLSFDLDQFSPNLGRLYFFTIRLLARLNQKSLALDLCDTAGECESGAKILLSHGLTKEQIHGVGQCDEDNLEDYLNEIDPKIFPDFDKHSEPHEIAKAARYIEATTYNAWYSTDFNIRNYESFKHIATYLLSELASIRLNPLNENNIKGKKVLESVLQTVIELVHENTENSPWMLGSDTPLDCFAFVSFGSDVEHETLDCENEHRQSIGESGAMRLDLDLGNAGFETVDNIQLGDLCLLTLASV